MPAPRKVARASSIWAMVTSCRSLGGHGRWRFPCQDAPSSSSSRHRIDQRPRDLVGACCTGNRGREYFRPAIARHKSIAHFSLKFSSSELRYISRTPRLYKCRSPCRCSPPNWAQPRFLIFPYRLRTECAMERTTAADQQRTFDGLLLRCIPAILRKSTSSQAGNGIAVQVFNQGPWSGLLRLSVVAERNAWDCFQVGTVWLSDSFDQFAERDLSFTDTNIDRAIAENVHRQGCRVTPPAIKPHPDSAFLTAIESAIGEVGPFDVKLIP